MVFNSLEFFVFFALVYFLYRRLSHPQQNLVLLAASVIFYGWWDWRFLFLLLLSSTIDYFAAAVIARSGERRRRVRYLALSMISNLAILGFFKYYNFFAESFQGLLQSLGAEAGYTTLHIVLPVGISFYTFQAMSYTIDVYRGELAPIKKFSDFFLFITFFPQLVAGPIERATHLAPQILNPRTCTAEKNREGIWLLLWGLFKKVVIADNLALVVNQAFARAGQLNGLETAFAAYAFAVQIYCDFSGYSDIARGAAKLLGFDLMLNFNLPYFAKNPSEFWKRWHISLSTWLRDYLYIPLGGNRRGAGQTYRNLMLTMLLGGLWHGAAWTFVAWGAYQGALLIGHRTCEKRLHRWLGSGKWISALSMVFNFQLVALGWLIFRAESFAQLQQMFLSLFSNWQLDANAAGMLKELLAYSSFLLAFQALQHFRRDLLPHLQWRSGFRLAWYSLLTYLIFAYGVMHGEDFIYFQF
jgi:D-alanyl-lipoteichoic acid acyltransferase DltB (MBOAT superfamily)